MDIYKQILKLQ